MVRKCNTTKYRRRMSRQHQNKRERKHRLQLIEAQYLKKQRETEAARKAAWLADPRRQLIQRLVNILYARLWANPAYLIIRTAKLFGVDIEGLLDSVLCEKSRSKQYGEYCGRPQ